MNNKQAAQILRDYNEWRRHDGEPCPFPHTSQAIGQAVDTAIEALGGIDWPLYRAEVAKAMLPVIYARVEQDTRQLRNSTDIAIDDTVDIALRLADKLEQQLKAKEVQQ